MCPLVLFYVNEETDCAGKIERFGRNCISAEIPPLECTVTAVPFLFACFLCLLSFVSFVYWRQNVPQIGTIVNFLDESKRCLTFVKCVRHFGKYHANHVNLARFYWLTATNTRFANRSHVKYEFTNTKKLLKKLARIEASSICRQQFANLFADCFCSVHTHQLEFANTSLPTLVCRVKAAFIRDCLVKGSQLRLF